MLKCQKKTDKSMSGRPEDPVVFRMRRLLPALSPALLLVFLLPALLLPALLLPAVPVLAANPDYHYVIGGRGRKRIPVSYTVERVFSVFGTDTVNLENPQDLFIDDEDNLYILDTGHNRIVVLDRAGAFLREIVPTGEAALNNPCGLYVDADGDLFVADTDHGRIVHLAPDGAFVESFVQPQSPIYDNTYPFRPIKVAIDSLGQMYVLNQDDYHGFIKLNAYNEFLGYTAPSKVTASIWDALIEMFASALQQELLGGKQPPVHTNITMLADDTFYATTSKTSTNQVKHFTSVGRNIFPDGSFGDPALDYVTAFFGGEINETVRFVDVCAGTDGIVSALDGASGRIYQYDQDGSMLAAFGGTGNWSGRFRKAAAICQDSQGSLYVLDNALGNIQVFDSTPFIDTVHQAIQLYADGRYEESSSPWQEVLAKDRNYHVAHLGMGKVYMKQERWQEAMAEYRIIGDKAGYSAAFASLRREYVRNHFALVILIPVLLLIALLLFVSRLGRLARLSQGIGIVTPFQTALNVVFSPWDGFMSIKRDRERFSALAPTLILAALLVSRVIQAFIEHYPLADQEPQYRNFIQEITMVLVPLLTWVVAHYLVTTIMGGESLLRETYSATAHAMLPLVLFSLPLALLSRIMELGDSQIYSLLWFALYLWCGILFLVAISSMNSYTLKQTLGIALISLVACLFIWSVLGLIYILMNKMFSFIADVIIQNRLYYSS